jgi:transcriptional regulator with XRE-family HTH domain
MNNLNLRFAIIRDGRRQFEVAMEAGISETKFSKIISGRLNPSLTEKRRIAAALGLRPEQLFESPKRELNPA